MKALLLTIILLWGGIVALWPPPILPKTNIWLTLANYTNSSTLCLAMASPDNPFSTCLVGVPLDDQAWPCPLSIKRVCSGKNKTDNWDVIIPQLPGLVVEPQELELLGSIKMDYCIMFSYSSNTTKKGQIVNATLPVYRNASEWCNYTSTNLSRSSNTPIQLPPGVFLICGDRAWPGVPSRLQGGPCSLGRLTVFLPKDTQIWQHRKNHARTKRENHAFESSCNSRVEFWNPGEVIASSIFAPGVAASQALTQLRKMGCWLAKQSNLTSIALDGLLTDVDSIRHATLQNRAAIDFLLLTHGHGCEDLDGMCCMNLSDHSESIHKALQTMKDQVNNLQISDGLGWLSKLLSGWGITGWLQTLVLEGGRLLLIILIMLLVFSCMFSCVKALVMRMVHQTWIAQKEERGIVEEWLDERGHVYLSLSNPALSSSNLTLTDKTVLDKGE